MTAIKLEVLGERKFKIKLKPSSSVPNVASEAQSQQNHVLSGLNKRKREAEVEEQPFKKVKIDSTVKRQCRGLLDALSTHKHGYVFSHPVNPVALGIPDYFTVITHPMDFGTIRSKLQANAYHTTSEFAADVKLTFSNAMLYNPPQNQVHMMAKELETLFLKRWKSLEAKWITPQKTSLDAVKTCSVNSVPPSLPARVPSKSSSKPSMSVDEKRKLKKDLVEILVGRMTEKLKSEFKKLGIEIPRKEVIDVEFDRFDADVLWQLKRVVKEARDSGGSNPKSNQTSSQVSVSKPKPNGERDIVKEALLVAQAARLKKLSAAADSEKALEEARRKKEEARLKLEARRSEEIKSLSSLESSSKKNFDAGADNHLVFEELMKLSGCYMSYDSSSGFVLRQHGKIVRPLASLGLRLKKEHTFEASDMATVKCDMEDGEEGEILE